MGARHSHRRINFIETFRGIQEILFNEGKYGYWNARYLFEMNGFSEQSAKFYADLVERLLLPKNVDTLDDLENMRISYVTASSRIFRNQGLSQIEFDYLYSEKSNGNGNGEVVNGE